LYIIKPLLLETENDYTKFVKDRQVKSPIKIASLVLYEIFLENRGADLV